MNKSKYRLSAYDDDAYASLSRGAAILGDIPFDVGAVDSFASPACASLTLDDLTEQERRVVVELQRGISNRQIARALQLSEHTIKFHLRNIFNKLGVHSRLQVLVWAVAVPTGIRQPA